MKFTKMHGLGNDFVVVDAISQRVVLTPAQVRAIADRRFGVGCDQLLLVEASSRSDVEFRYRIFNADGGEVGQCGNGARCFARFVRDHHLTRHDTIRVETASGDITLYLEPNGDVRVNMGPPRFAPPSIPLAASAEQAHYRFDLEGGTALELGAVSMGNPHGVLRVEAVDQAPVAQLGPQLESHPAFPERANIGFMQVMDRNHIRLRVFERGAGETLACGTGACAAVAVGRRWGLLDEQVEVQLPGGRLTIHWAGGEGDPLWMSGPAVSVFHGELDLAQLPRVR